MNVAFGGMKSANKRHFCGGRNQTAAGTPPRDISRIMSRTDFRINEAFRIQQQADDLLKSEGVTRNRHQI